MSAIPRPTSSSDQPSTDAGGTAARREPASKPEPKKAEKSGPSAWLSAIVGLDLRSLALLRVGIALCLLIDLAIRVVDLDAHYTDGGILPRDTAIETSDAWHYSLHLVSGLPVFQAALFAIAAIFAICLLLGFRTRLACVTSWILLVSLQNRNFIILNGADVLLRMTLFWGIFLPLGARFSVDTRAVTPSTGKAPPRDNWHFSAGAIFYAIQFIVVYVFAGLIKLDVPEWREGSGFAYALRSPEFASIPAAFIVDNVPLMRALNGATVYGELFGSLLLLCPIFRGAARIFLVIGFASLHILIATFMSVGMFPLVGVVAVTAFLPSVFWDRGVFAARKWLQPRTQRIARFVSVSKEWLLAPLVQRVPARRSSALDRLVTGGIGAVCIAFVVLGNIAAYRPLPFTMPEKVMWISPFFRLEQRWDMFAQPLTAGGWFVIPARLTSGVEVDLYAERVPPSWQKPKMVADTFSNARWKKYFMNIAAPQFAQHRLHYGRYLCRKWSLTHTGPHSLEAFKVYWLRQAVGPWDEPGPAQRTMLWQHECREGLLNKWGSLL